MRHREVEAYKDFRSPPDKVKSTAHMLTRVHNMYGRSIELISMEVVCGLHTHNHLYANVLNLMLIHVHFETFLFIISNYYLKN